MYFSDDFSVQQPLQFGFCDLDSILGYFLNFNFSSLKDGSISSLRLMMSWLVPPKSLDD